MLPRTFARLAGVALVACAGCASVQSPLPAPPPAPVSAPVPAPVLAMPPPPATASSPTAPDAAMVVPPNVRREFDAARRALAAKRFDEAERGFLALTKTHPEFGGPFANLAIVYRQSGKHAESVAALEQAVLANPREPAYYNQLGIAHRHAGQFAKARDAYEKAIGLDADYASAILNLGILNDIYLRDGPRALALYERYLALTPAGDDEVRKWISDLKNRAAAKSSANRKEQP
jgi:tetratricopeptide (TPR) repeat protein